MKSIRPPTKSVLLGTLVWLAACGSLSGAASLWTAGSRSRIADRRAAAPGEVVTILVVQQSTTSHQAAHETGKQFSVSGGPGGGILDFFPELSLSTDRTTAGAGRTSESTRLTDRISGVIVERTPEGNLRIEAKRSVKLNRDKLTLVLSGLVRPDDISPDNTISSTHLADLQVECSGRGPIPEKQRPGLLSALLSLLW